MKPIITLVLCAAIAAQGCATTGAARGATTTTPQARTADRAVLAEYVRTLPLGSAVRVDLAGGRALRGTLMKATDQDIVISPRTRIPEPPVEVPLDTVVAVTPDSQGRSNLAVAIGAGVAAGAGAAVAVFMIIVALMGD